MIKHLGSRALKYHPILKGLILSALGRKHPVFLDEPVNPPEGFPHPIFLEYAPHPRARYGYGKASHPELHRLIDLNREIYRQHLRQFLEYSDHLVSIPLLPDEPDAAGPFWLNGWMPGLDAIALYCLVARNNPKRYVEIGSGHSTKFVRRAIVDHNLQTLVTSVDPHPRAEIDRICDRVVRQPIEDIDLSLIRELEAGDVLFVDSSHRAFMGSDVAVFFLEVLPRLTERVFVHLHDVFLPQDYPPEWAHRYYSEQYLMAAALLAGGTRFDIQMPTSFVVNDPELNGIVVPLWEQLRLEGTKTYGSFWFRTMG